MAFKYSPEYTPRVPAGSTAKKQVELSRAAEQKSATSTSPLKTGVRFSR